MKNTKRNTEMTPADLGAAAARRDAKNKASALLFTPAEICDAIRHINCMSQPDFWACWGDKEIGDYMWRKFEDEHDKNIGRFLMYLDGGNQQILFKHCRQFLDKFKD